MPDSSVQLVTPHLVLATPEASDAPAVLDYFERNRDHLAPWDPVRPADFYTEKHWQERFEAEHRSRRAHLSLRLILRDPNDMAEKVIGTCNFSNVIRGSFQCATLGYSMDRGYQGKGVMYEALSHAIPLAWKDLHLHR